MSEIVLACQRRRYFASISLGRPFSEARTCAPFNAGVQEEDRMTDATDNTRRELLEEYFTAVAILQSYDPYFLTIKN